MNKLVIGTAAALIGSLNIANATQINLVNPDFNSQLLGDGAFTSGNIQGWARINGSAGIYNPPGTVFSNEGGSGTRENTLYLNGNSVVAQTLNTSLTANTDYTITFDVGDRFDTSLPNYIVRIKVGGNTVFNAINPVVPQVDGSFETVSLSFNSGNNSFAGGLMTLELEATGTGQVNLDNFVLSAVVGEEPSDSKFGDWQHQYIDGTTFYVDTVYQAATDGFITYGNSGSCSGNSDQFRVSDNPVTTSDAMISRVFGTGGTMVPVKKGQYWLIQRYTSGPSCNAYIGFLPLL